MNYQGKPEMLAKFEALTKERGMGIGFLLLKKESLVLYL